MEGRGGKANIKTRDSGKKFWHECHNQDVFFIHR